MDFEESEEERAFRAEARAWLSEHAKPRVPGGPSDHSYVPGERTPDADLEHVQACREWQRTLFAGGWAGSQLPAVALAAPGITELPVLSGLPAAPA